MLSLLELVEFGLKSCTLRYTQALISHQLNACLAGSEISTKSAQRRWMNMWDACTTIQMSSTCAAKSNKHSRNRVPWNESCPSLIPNNNIQATCSELLIYKHLK